MFEKIKLFFKKISEGFLKFLRNPVGMFALFVIVLVLINLVASNAFFRWDITSPKSYSLSPSSREIVKTVDEPLNIKVFFSDNLSAPYSTTYQYLKDILSEYKSAGNKNFIYELFDMDKEESQKLASSFGIQQMQIREVSDTEVGFKNVYMGLVVSYSDQNEILNGLTSSDGLEYKITNAISKVISNTNALLGLSKNVSVTLYQSTNLKNLGVMGFDDLETAVRSAVFELNKKYDDRLELTINDPSSSDVISLAEKFGVPSYELQKNDGSLEYGTLSIVLESDEKNKIIPIKIGQGLGISDDGFQMQYNIQGLEYVSDYMDESLKALASNVTSVAYVTGHGEIPLSEENGAAILSSLLAEHYSLQEVNLLESDIPYDVSCVMINGPKSIFDESELYKLDQFLMSGGNLLMFLDPFDPDAQQSEYGMPNYIPLDTGLDKLLTKYGIALNKEYVMDEKCAKTQDQWTGRIVDLYYAPMLESEGLNQKHSITKNLGNIMFFLPGSIDAQEAEKNPDEKVTILARSSKKSWTVKDNFILDSNYLTPPSSAEEKESDLIVLVEGKFNSAFDSAPVKEVEDIEKEDGEENSDSKNSSYKSETHLTKSTQNGKVLLVSSSYISSAYLGQSIFQNTALMIENLVDYMSENPDRCSMRTKGLSLAALEVSSKGVATFVKYFNEFGLAVLVALVGLFVLLWRKKRRIQIRQKYNPGDAREEPKKINKVKTFAKKGGKNE